MAGSEVIAGLISRGIPAHIAYGIAGNMQIESDGFQTDVNEYAPLVPGSRGGYGLNQWTGPRRRQYEAFAADRGVNPSDLDTQLDFTLWELQNTEAPAWMALRQASTPGEAAQIYSEKFLRPGIPHLERRVAAAAALAERQSEPASGAQNALASLGGPDAETTAEEARQQSDERQRNQLAMLDPRSFMTQQNPLALIAIDTRNPFERGFT